MVFTFQLSQPGAPRSQVPTLSTQVLCLHVAEAQPARLGSFTRVDAMHGRVTVTSEVGGGSTFSIVLPAGTSNN